MKERLLFSWVVGVALLLATNSMGYDIGCGNEDNPDDDCDEVGTSSISPYRAEKRREVTDLETYGVAPVAFTRHYNSRTTAFTTNYCDFGAKQTWQHNWNYEVRDLDSTTYGFHDIKVRYPSGTEYNFKAADANGVIFVPPAFQGDRLYKWAGSTVGYTLVTPGGLEHDFQRTTSPRYHMMRTRNGQGLTWTLSYDGYGRIQRIQNDFGRWIEIERGVTNNALCITGLLSSDGRHVSFAYEQWVDEDTTNNVLSEAIYPDGTEAEYTYVGGQSLTNGRPLLATASDPRHPGPGARVRFVYNYDAIFDFGNGPYLVTGTTLEERNLVTDELVVSLPMGSGDYPQILQGDGAELTRRYTNGLLVEKRDAEGRPTTFTRDQGGSGFVGSMTTADGATTTFQRDYAGRVLNKINPLGYTNSSTYNDAGFVSTKTDELGASTSYTRNTNNQPTRTDYPDGTFEEWTYNQYGQVLTHRQRDTGTETFGYYAAGESGGLPGDLKARTNALGGVTTYTWNSAGLPISTTDVRSNTVSVSYNWRGNLLFQTNADQTVVSYQYDSFGNQTNKIDELGRPTESTYDEFNRVKSVRDPLGRVTTYEYGLAPGCGCGTFGTTITRITNAAGGTTEYTYDHSGKRLSETIDAGTAEAATNTWTYDDTGRLAGGVDANGIAVEYVYDKLGQRVAVSRGGLLVASNRYDAAGRIVWQQDENGLVTTNVFDAAGRLLRACFPDGSFAEQVFTNTFLVRRYDRAARLTRYDRDVLGRVTNQVDNATNSVAYRYDSAGNVTNLVDQSGNVTRFRYDQRGRLIAKIYADGVSNSFVYNAAGRQAQKTDGKGAVTQYHYDEAGNLTNIVYPNDPAVVFEYDSLNRMTKMVDGIGTSCYTYVGTVGFIVSFDGPFSDDTVDYGYDAGHRQTSVSLHGLEVAYQFDDLNRIISVTTDGQTNEYAYEGNGKLVSSLILGNGARTEYGYDMLKRLTNLVNKTSAGAPFSSFAYTLDNADDRTSVTHGGSGSSKTISYTYDPVGQLISAQGSQPGHAFSYSYDPARNPIQQVNNGFVVNNAFNELNQNTTDSWSGAVTVLGTANTTNGTVTVNGYPAQLFSDRTFVATNLPVIAGSNTYTAIITDCFGRQGTNHIAVHAINRRFSYDANGNLTNDGTRAYAYDDADRLTEVRDVDSGSLLMTCRYDGLGRRRERVEYADGVGVTNRYIYDGWLVLAVLDGSTNVLETYVHSLDVSGALGGAGGIGGILSTRSLESGTWVFFHYDGNGNVIGVTDTNQLLVAKYEYGPFGTLLLKSGTFDARFRFSSKEYDPSTGLYYYGYRFYCPALGRWLSRDPLWNAEFTQLPNLYCLVANSPENTVDVLGLAVTCTSWSEGSVFNYRAYALYGIWGPWRPLYESSPTSCSADAGTWFVRWLTDVRYRHNTVIFFWDVIQSRLCEDDDPCADNPNWAETRTLSKMRTEDRVEAETRTSKERLELLAALLQECFRYDPLAPE